VTVADQMWIRGENGALHLFDVPLPFGIESRLVRGDLVRVHEDGSPWVEPSEEPDVIDAGPPDAPPLPRRTDNRAAWTEFAVGQGMDRAAAVALTKAELIALLTQPDA
jgi:hypothetical protein